MNFNYTFLARYIKNIIISACNQCTNDEMFNILFFIRSLQNQVCV